MADNSTLPATGDIIAADDVGGVKFQRVKPAWGVDGVATDVAATTPLPTSINASIFVFSTLNTSSAELAASATFTGTIESVQDQPSISLMMTSDQPMLLTVYQYIDAGGTYAVAPITFNTVAGVGFSRSFALNGNYCKVTAQNLGTATTTTFELNTAYGNLPSADGAGNNPVSLADCVLLLTSTITGVGVSGTIDTAGFNAIVIQLSGVWQGNLTVEGSNTGSVWDGLLVHSRDNPALIDIVTQGGLYTIRPAGRYLRLNVSNITGSMSVSAIGRSGTGVDASDYLSLAMDRQNNTPLNVALMGTKQDAQGALSVSDCAGPYIFKGMSATAVMGVIDTIGYSAISLQFSGGNATAWVEFSNDLLTWGWVQCYRSDMLNGTSIPGNTNGIAFTAVSTQSVFIACSTSHGRYVRIRLTAYTSGTPTCCAYLRNVPLSPFSVGTQPVSLGANTALIGDVGVEYRANATGAATISKFTAAATTNAASVKASAGRVLGWSLTNTTASVKYFRFFNKASSPTVGTDSPVFVITIPANGVAAANFEGGIGFATGIAIACTGAVADLDTTVTAANDVIGAIFYA